MNNRFFQPNESEKNSDIVGQGGRLDSIQHMIKVPIAIWIGQDRTRIKLLRKAIDNSFSTEMQDYQELLSFIKELFQNPQHFLRNIRTDSPEQTMKDLVEEASTVAITEYLKIDPGYEEILNNEDAEEDLLKKTLQSNEEKIEKNNGIVPDVNDSADAVTAARPLPFSPKVR